MSELDKKIAAIEIQMGKSDFWNDKDSAQKVVQVYKDLKEEKEGIGKFDKGNAIVTIFGGAGGDDAEDFAAMLTKMYFKYIEDQGWETEIVHKNENDQGGYRNITFQVSGRNSYGTLKNESGVHRLVRISPFNAQKKRHTSFAMVEVIPKFKNVREGVEIDESKLDIQFTRSSGPGGQNVNKRDTAVRIVHRPTGISVHADNERSQAQNKEKALAILSAKLFRRGEEEQREKSRGMQISATTEIEWGNQIRSYVLHPYKMVKDHRTGAESKDPEKVLEDGEIQLFIDAERDL